MSEKELSKILERFMPAIRTAGRLLDEVVETACENARTDAFREAADLIDEVLAGRPLADLEMPAALLNTAARAALVVGAWNAIRSAVRSGSAKLPDGPIYREVERMLREAAPVPESEGTRTPPDEFLVAAQEVCHKVRTALSEGLGPNGAPLREAARRAVFHLEDVLKAGVPVPREAELAEAREQGEEAMRECIISYLAGSDWYNTFNVNLLISEIRGLSVGTDKPAVDPQAMTDVEFLGYVETHSQKPLARFSRAQVLRLCALAGREAPLVTDEWVQIHYADARPVIAEARRRKDAADWQQILTGEE